MSSDENPVILKKQRAMIKSSCTRIRTYVDKIETPSVRAQLAERRSKLEQYWGEYNDVQLRLEVIDDTKDNDCAGFEESFYDLSAKIRELLEPAHVAPRDAMTLSPTTTEDSRIQGSATHVRLPKISLPTFGGRYDDWFPFFDAFKSIIHSNASLSELQKLQYLRASLVGEASDVISSLEISGVNYEIAWRMLKERYDNKRVIVHSHVKAIMELPSMHKENVTEMRQIADGASKHINTLRALSRPTELGRLTRVPFKLETLCAHVARMTKLLIGS